MLLRVAHDLISQKSDSWIYTVIAQVQTPDRVRCNRELSLTHTQNEGDAALIAFDTSKYVGVNADSAF